MQRVAPLSMSSSSESEPQENAPPPITLPDGRINPDYVELGFQQVIDAQNSGYGGRPRRKPFRFQLLLSAFRPFFQRNESAPLVVLAQPFIDSENAYSNSFGTTQTAISEFNEA